MTGWVKAESHSICPGTLSNKELQLFVLGGLIQGSNRLRAGKSVAPVPMQLRQWRRERRRICTHCLPPCAQTVQPQLESQMNLGSPETAFSSGQLLKESIGFTLFALIINNAIGVHPKALLNCDTPDGENRALADRRMRGHSSPKEFYIHKTTGGVATLAASVYPKHTMSEQHEPSEEKLMIGFRGCGCYTEQFFLEGLAIEQGAVKIVQVATGLTNAKIIILFVHVLDTARDLNEVREDGPKVNMMAELPSSVSLAEEFLSCFAGLSIGSNDLMQLTLGLGRDSGVAAPYYFVVTNLDIMKSPEIVIKAARAKGKYVKICKDNLDLARWPMTWIRASTPIPFPTWQFLSK